MVAGFFVFINRGANHLTYMQYVLIIHEVADYLAWKKVFDSAADIRKEAGVKAPDFIYLDQLEVGTL
jgi:hypothetical protein